MLRKDKINSKSVLVVGIYDEGGKIQEFHTETLMSIESNVLYEGL